MIRQGEVTEKNGELLAVVFERPQACKQCNGCMNHQCTRLEIAGDAEIGDVVEVELPDKSVVKASALMYLIPLAGLILGIALGTLLHAPLGIGIDKDLFCAGCGILVLAIGLFAVYGVDKWLRNKRDWQPSIVGVHKKQP